jgi:multidrug transporter EmrE-like cation transporter
LIYLLALVSIFLGAVGQFLLKVGAKALGEGGSVGHTLLQMAVTPAVLLGVVCFGTSFISWVFVLRKLDLAVAYPMVSLGYIIVVVLAKAFLGEQITLPKVVGLGLIIAGVIAMNVRTVGRA